VDDESPKDNETNQLHPSITPITLPYAPGNLSGSMNAQPYSTNAQALFMQGQPFIGNLEVTSSIEPQVKRARLEDPDTSIDMTSTSYDGTSAPSKSDSNIEGDEKELNAGDTANFLSMSESDFAKSLDDPNVTIRITIPNDRSNNSWNLNGQCITLTLNVMTKIKVIKEKLQTQLGMPINKMQLRNSTIGFLKDTTSLAYCNIGNMNPVIELVPKTRGGRK
jgi:hypothetical protein